MALNKPQLCCCELWQQSKKRVAPVFFFSSSQRLLSPKAGSKTLLPSDVKKRVTWEKNIKRQYTRNYPYGQKPLPNPETNPAIKALRLIPKNPIQYDLVTGRLNDPMKVGFLCSIKVEIGGEKRKQKWWFLAACYLTSNRHLPSTLFLRRIQSNHFTGSVYSGDIPKQEEQSAQKHAQQTPVRSITSSTAYLKANWEKCIPTQWLIWTDLCMCVFVYRNIRTFILLLCFGWRN